MRLLAPVAAVLALASLRATPATACGPFVIAPRLHRILTLSVPGHGARSFVVLGAAPTAHISAWHRLAPESHDATDIADLPDEAPRRITLIGPTGVTTVTNAHRVALDHDLELGNGPHEAIEVRLSDYAPPVIAIDGDAREATWHRVVSRGRRIVGIADTELHVVPAEAGYIVMSGTRSLMTGTGQLLGAFDFRGESYIVDEPLAGDPQAIDIGSTD